MAAALGWGALAASSLVVGGAHARLADATGGHLRAAIDGFAAGALRVMLIDSMIPEAASKAGSAGGLVTVLGFAVAATLSGVWG